METSRRALIAAGLLAGGAAVVPGARGATLRRTNTAAARPLGVDPFTLGVASGDPAADGVVLWTRLARDPLADDGLGGMPRRGVEVKWQLANDSEMRDVFRSGVAVARRDFAHAVHIGVDGLEPGREYWYRFKAEGYVSRIGRTMTAPARNSSPKSLRMSFVSCAQFEHGFFTAHRRLAQDAPDLVLHLGDYQYEYGRNRVYSVPTVRDHEGPETTTLAGYRQRHAQYKSDGDLQRAHAVAPWLVVFGDHEVENGWAGEIGKPSEGNFLQRRAAAFRAYYENMPLRKKSLPSGPGMRLYRRLHWGDLATFHMLDTRQFRDDLACGGGYEQGCMEADDPLRTITGGDQEQWLIAGFAASTARWDLIGQQVFFARRDTDEGRAMDTWDGYSASRRRITQGWVDAEVRNPVVLTGDAHAHWAADLKLDYEIPGSPTVGSELVCSSVSSTGDGADAPARSHPWVKENSHLLFQNDLRGYVNTTIDRDAMTADFRSLNRVTMPGEPAFTRASFRIVDGVRGLQRTADNPTAAASTDRLSDAEMIRRTISQEKS